MPTIFRHGHIRTLGRCGIVGALLCGDDGTIIATGPDAETHPLTETAISVDLGGHTALPGPVDGHVHLLWNAQNDLWQADLSGSRSIDELLGRLAVHAERRTNGWLLGHGFDHELFPDRAFPTKRDLDLISPDRPCLISRVCYHAVVASSRALELAGVSSESGILTEDRMDPVYACIPEPTPDERLEICCHGMELAARAGFTGAHVLIDSADDARAFQTLHDQGRLPIRVRMQIPYRLLGHLAAMGLFTGFGDEWLSVGAVKLFTDGSMGARTAALTTPYSDDPGNTGELSHSPEELARMCREVDDAGCQVVLHAIGDRAMDVAMDAIVHAAGSETRARRHRIEHASIVRPDQIQRLADTGIMCCIQPQFVVTDFWTIQRVGPERKKWIYPFASMLRAGIPLSGGTDCPVERLDPLQAVGRAVTRDAPWHGDGIGQGYAPEESLSVDQAWRLYTEGSAYSAFLEGKHGNLDPGMAGDFVVLDGDPFTCAPREIETLSPVMTVVGGSVKYRRDHSLA